MGYATGNCCGGAEWLKSSFAVTRWNSFTPWPRRASKGAHFAVFPDMLVEPCILAGCPEGGMVLDPFAGSGTTGVVAKRLGRNFTGVEINPAYCKLAADRIAAS